MNYRNLLVLACSLVVAQAYFVHLSDEPWEAPTIPVPDWAHKWNWEHFKQKYNKKYPDEATEKTREAIWLNNTKLIDAHNAQHQAGNSTFRLGENANMDLTPKEFAAKFTGLRKKDNDFGSGRPVADLSQYRQRDLPHSVNWISKGYVTPIKNQQQCGSCWAFSATGSMEGQHFKKTGKLVSLSEQNLVDCSMAEGNYGCGGGLMDYAFNYTVINKGIDTEASYPYTAMDGTCKFNKTNVGATISSWTDVPSGSEMDLQKAVATVGPVSVGIDASQYTFQLYKSGVYYDPNCSSQLLDHGVLAVGYGTTKMAGKSTDFWLVKNSWGVDWGMKGYIEMSRNKDNNCGIATSASYPVV